MDLKCIIQKIKQHDDQLITCKLNVKDVNGNLHTGMTQEVDNVDSDPNCDVNIETVTEASPELVNKNEDSSWNINSNLYPNSSKVFEVNSVFNGVVKVEYDGMTNNIYEEHRYDEVPKPIKTKVKRMKFELVSDHFHCEQCLFSCTTQEKLDDHVSIIHTNLKQNNLLQCQSYLSKDRNSYNQTPETVEKHTQEHIVLQEHNYLVQAKCEVHLTDLKDLQAVGKHKYKFHKRIHNKNSVRSTRRTGTRTRSTKCSKKRVTSSCLKLRGKSAEFSKDNQGMQCTNNLCVNHQGDDHSDHNYHKPKLTNKIKCSKCRENKPTITIKLISCDLCPNTKTFSSRSKLEEHVIKFHARLKAFQCYLCSTTFMEAANFMMHSVHCNRKSQDSYSYVGHQSHREKNKAEDKKVHHLASPDSDFFSVCDVCFDCFNNEIDFTQHLVDVHNKLFYCGICKKSFFNINDFDKHFKMKECETVVEKRKYYRSRKSCEQVPKKRNLSSDVVDSNL